MSKLSVTGRVWLLITEFVPGDHGRSPAWQNGDEINSDGYYLPLSFSGSLICLPCGGRSNQLKTVSTLASNGIDLKRKGVQVSQEKLSQTVKQNPQYFFQNEKKNNKQTRSLVGGMRTWRSSGRYTQCPDVASCEMTELHASQSRSFTSDASAFNLLWLCLFTP